jgi:membrane glycosyltransferase
MSRTYTNRTVVRKHIQYPEEEVTAVRRHLIVLSAPIATTLGATAVAIATSVISESKITAALVWLLSGLVICGQVAAFVDWYLGFFVITSRKLILSTSPVAKKLVTTKLSAISNIKVQSSWRGRLLGYGSLEIRSAEEGELIIAYIRYPQSLYEEISKLVQDVESRYD